MESLYRYTVPPSTCGYLPTQRWSLEYEMVVNLSPAEYETRLEEGWRRFGVMMFHPRCPACSACQPLRVNADRFRPNRSQRRAWRANHDAISVRVGSPGVSRAKLELYDRFHAFQTDHRNWPEHAPKDIGSYRETYVHNPEFTQEWCYYLQGRLVGVGYTDRLPKSMSAIYFFYEPAERHRSLGTFNVLCLLAECVARGLPHLYLGYFVKGCQSLEYKAAFKPNEVRNVNGTWRDFIA